MYGATWQMRCGFFTVDTHCHVASEMRMYGLRTLPRGNVAGHYCFAWARAQLNFQEEDMVLFDDGCWSTTPRSII